MERRGKQETLRRTGQARKVDRWRFGTKKEGNKEVRKTGKKRQR